MISIIFFNAKLSCWDIGMSFFLLTNWILDSLFGTAVSSHTFFLNITCTLLQVDQTKGARVNRKPTTLQQVKVVRKATENVAADSSCQEVAKQTKNRSELVRRVVMTINQTTTIIKNH
jgi:hypothetical protein